MTQPTPEALVEWLGERLAEGQSMARRLRSMIEQRAGQIVLIAPATPSSPDMRWGGVGQQDWGLLVSKLVSEWPHASLVVELPLADAADPGLDKLSTLICGSEVYAHAPISDGKHQLSAALRAHDPSSLYVAAALMPVPGRPVLHCPTEALEASDVIPVAVVVGAYDGEAFVYWSAGAAPG